MFLFHRHYHTLNKLMREMSGDVESDNSSVYGNICARVPFPLAIPSVDDTETTEFEKDNIVTHHSRIAATMAKIKLKEESGKDNKIVGRMMQGRNLERYAQVNLILKLIFCLVMD